MSQKVEGEKWMYIVRDKGLGEEGTLTQCREGLERVEMKERGRERGRCRRRKERERVKVRRREREKVLEEKEKKGKNPRRLTTIRKAPPTLSILGPGPLFPPDCPKSPQVTWFQVTWSSSSATVTSSLS